MTIYLDYNATTPVDPKVYEVMLPYLRDNFYNPSSSYSEAKGPQHAVQRAREEVLQLIGATDLTEIIFTGSATESNNLALRGVLSTNPNRKHIITTQVEHPSIYELCKDLEKSGYEVTYLSVNEKGELDVKEIINSIRPDTALCSIMFANNETGVLFPIEQISRMVKLTDKRIVFHTDATQVMGKVSFNLSKELEYVDMLSFSGHKLYAPKGIGVLYRKKGTPYRAMIVGGHQERGLRAGTENVPYIVGLGKACMLAKEHLANDDKTLQKFRDQIEKVVKKMIPAIQINGEGASRMDNTTNISFQSIEGESILYALNEKQICASTGSACSSGSLAPSHVLQAMKIPFTFAHGSLRISLGRFTTQNDIDQLLEVLPSVVLKLREISPFWDSKLNIPKEA